MKCHAVIVTFDGRSHSCGQDTFCDPDEDLQGDFCEYHLEQLYEETGFPAVVPHSAKRSPRGAELLAAFARAFEWNHPKRWGSSGKHDDWMFWTVPGDARAVQ